LSNDVKPIAHAPAAQNATLNTSLAGPPPNAVKQLMLLINSRNPIITLETSEEQRFLAVLERVAGQLDIPLWVWSVTTGLARAGGAALYTAFSTKQQLSTGILLGEIQATRPLSVTRAEEIAAIREWAKDRAVPAD
jgi:hypothetical protein